MKITNDTNTTIIGSNTTNGFSYRISKECYVALEELFKEQIGKIESNKPIIVEE